MTKRHNTLYGAIGLVIGIIGGISGTAFSMGADRQRINDILTRHDNTMISMEEVGKEHFTNNKAKIDRLSQILADQIAGLQLSITDLTHVVADVRTDVQVIKALMERVENDIKNTKNR